MRNRSIPAQSLRNTAQDHGHINGLELEKSKNCFRSLDTNPVGVQNDPGLRKKMLPIVTCENRCFGGNRSSNNGCVLWFDHGCHSLDQLARWFYDSEQPASRKLSKRMYRSGRLQHKVALRFDQDDATEHEIDCIH